MARRAPPTEDGGTPTTVFRTLTLRLRPPTGRKARVLAWVMQVAGAAQDAALALLQEQHDELVTLARAERVARRLEARVRLGPGDWDGLHSSLRNAAIAAAAAQASSYLELRARAERGHGHPPTWPGSARAGWPDYDATLAALATLADDEDQERLLTAELGRAAFQRKEDWLAYRTTLWFPRLDGARRARNAALLTDGRNLWALLYLMAPNHPDAAPIRGDGRLREVGGAPWTAHSKCAVIVPIETDRHAWQHAAYLEPLARGELRAQTAQLYRRANGDWYLGVQCAADATLAPPARWYGLAYERGTPVLVDAAGTVHWQGDERLQAVAGQGILDRAGRQRRGQDISYRRPTAAAGKEVSHRWANAIVALCRAADAGVAFPATARAGRPGQPRALLRQILTYKLALAGLPLRLVSAKGAPWACPACGGVVPKGPAWACPACGLTLAGPGLAVAWHAARRLVVE